MNKIGENKNLENDWEKKLISDLGSKNYNELFSKTDDGVEISPFYTHSKNLLIDPKKLYFPKNWKILSEIDYKESLELDSELENLIKNEIYDVVLKNYRQKDLDIDKFKELSIYFNTSDIRAANQYKNSKLNIILEPNLNEQNILRIDNYEGDKFDLNISSEFIKNSGSNIVQEIAFTISAAIDYVNEFGKDVIKNISFELFQGSNYFLEIAKIQAFRIVWSLVTKEFGNQKDNCSIITKPCVKNKTIKNFNNNIVRSTSECMSGILGGCNYVKSVPYDIKFKERNLFSQRILNNQLLILKNETSINKVSNSICGSYYIMFLIEKLAEKSTELLKRIENEGGYINNLKNGIFNEISLNAEKVKQQYISKEKILVGQNKFADE